MSSLSYNADNKFDASCTNSDFNHFGNFQRSNKKSKKTICNEREAIQTLLATADDVGADCTDNFLQAEISYNDLAALSRDDLDLLGIKQKCQQDELLETFKNLTRQSPSYDQIVNSPQSQLVNKEIMIRSTAYLNLMRTSLAAVNYKLKFSPSIDGIIDNKHFASKFVIEALTELKRVTDDIDKELDGLEHKFKNMDRPEKYTYPLRFNIAVMALVATTIIGGFWMWKSR